MGAKITALRKARGMTQEQLAAALGVSGPAVSKWETGSSCPDIMLLCPLARVLGTNVDTLPSFEEELSQEDLENYMGEIIELAREDKISRAEERLNGLLHRYPTDIPLKFSAIAALSLFNMNGEDGQQGTAGGDTDRWTRRFMPCKDRHISWCMTCVPVLWACWERKFRRNRTGRWRFAGYWSRLTACFPWGETWVRAWLRRFICVC